ncbi:MAG: Sua5/YciO/YrdC/YwlC family protein [Betaproteobacteria bacterium]|nr:Sua5/YciO/YrdC/YwlC family protein [Betaproteobacteria bacterium]
MSFYDCEADAERVFRVVADGGLAIIPCSIGYAIVGVTPAAIHRAFEAKRRSPSKLNALTGCKPLHLALHDVDARGREVVRAITEDLDLPLGTVARYRAEHPMVQRIPPEVLAQSTRQGTVAMLVNAGPFLEALGWLSFTHGLPIIGSSANLSQRGVKFRVEDIEPEVRAAADLVIDHGLMRWACYRCSSTMLDVNEMKVVRHGIGFDLIQDRLRRQFGIELPGASDPAALR